MKELERVTGTTQLDSGKTGCDTGSRRLKNTMDGSFPQWAWDVDDDGVLVAKHDTMGECRGEEAYRLLMQGLRDCTAAMTAVAPERTPFED